MTCDELFEKIAVARSMGLGDKYIIIRPESDTTLFQVATKIQIIDWTPDESQIALLIE